MESTSFLDVGTAWFDLDRVMLVTMIDYPAEEIRNLEDFRLIQPFMYIRCTLDALQIGEFNFNARSMYSFFPDSGIYFRHENKYNASLLSFSLLPKIPPRRGDYDYSPEEMPLALPLQQYRAKQKQIIDYMLTKPHFHFEQEYHRLEPKLTYKMIHIIRLDRIASVHGTKSTPRPDFNQGGYNPLHKHDWFIIINNSAPLEFKGTEREFREFLEDFKRAHMEARGQVEIPLISL